MNLPTTVVGTYIARKDILKTYLHSSVYLSMIKSKETKKNKLNGYEASFKLNVVQFTHTCGDNYIMACAA